MTPKQSKDVGSSPNDTINDGLDKLYGSSSLREQIGSTLQNFAVCRDYIGGDEYMKGGEFDVHLRLTFGDRDTTKPPIDDLFDKATSKLASLIASYIEAADSLLEKAVESSGNEFAMGYNDSGCFWSFYAGARGAGNMLSNPAYTSESSEPLEALQEYLDSLQAQKALLEAE